MKTMKKRGMPTMNYFTVSGYEIGNGRMGICIVLSEWASNVDILFVNNVYILKMMEKKHQRYVHDCNEQKKKQKEVLEANDL